MYFLEYDQGCGERICAVNHKCNIQSGADCFSGGAQVHLTSFPFYENWSEEYLKLCKRTLSVCVFTGLTALKALLLEDST